MTPTETFRYEIQNAGITLKSDGVGISAHFQVKPSAELMERMKARRAELIAAVKSWPFEMPVVQNGSCLNPVNPADLLDWLARRKAWPAVQGIAGEAVYGELCDSGDMVRILGVALELENLADV